MRPMAPFYIDLFMFLTRQSQILKKTLYIQCLVYSLKLYIDSEYYTMHGLSKI
jgi:hypothetical protein